MNATRFLRLADVDVRGRRVFIRSDLNVPQADGGQITTTHGSVHPCPRSWTR